jgi:hypothetical protein
VRRLHASIALVVAAVAAISASASGSTRALPVIELVSTRTTYQPHDVAPKGPSKGDTVFTTSQLTNYVPQFDRPKRELVGTDRRTIAMLTRTTGTVEGLTRLPGGTLVLRGTVRFVANGMIIAVRDGTGEYAGAHGTLTVSECCGDAKKTLNVYRLTYT